VSVRDIGFVFYPVVIPVYPHAISTPDGSDGEKLFLFDKRRQISHALELIIKLCDDYKIPNKVNVKNNWKKYFEHYTTNKQEMIRENKLVIGTRGILQNRIFVDKQTDRERRSEEEWVEQSWADLMNKKRKASHISKLWKIKIAQYKQAAKDGRLEKFINDRSRRKETQFC